MTVPSISAEEWELVSFFGALPTDRPADEPWPYTEIVFEVRRGGHRLSCAIAPAYKDVRLVLVSEASASTSPLYELNAVDVVDVACRKDGRTETLEIRLSDKDAVLITVDPAIKLSHVGLPPGWTRRQE